MTVYDVVLFDLDGTLTDPKIGITRSIQYALSKAGIEENDVDKLVSFIGAPLTESFRKYYSFDESEARHVVESYREYYSAKGIYENAVYPGIPELLESLKSRGKRLIVATLKPKVYADRVLEHFALSEYFSFVAGSDLEMTVSSKKEIIRAAVAKASNKPGQKLVMVGDREQDIVGAHEAGIDSIAVAYGYGTLEELRRAGPTHVAHSVEDLKELIN